MNTAWRFVTQITVGCLLSVLLLGRLDERLGTSPWLMLAGLIFSIAGSLYLLVKEGDK